MYVVISTCTAKEADALVNSLLNEHLIACANVMKGIQSHYWWEGKLCHDEETFLWMETSDDMVEVVTKRIQELHSYTVPKVLSFKIDHGNQNFLEWVNQVTRK